jgi:hypothetical protein
VSDQRDRGWALEQSWSPRDNETLRSWQADADQLRRPAAIFNATLVESGEQLQLSTAGPTYPTVPAPRTFLETYLDRDLPITTAVRLSAAFTYVSPTPRPSNDCCADPTLQYHVADGGYYDNYGIHSALRWILLHRDSWRGKKKLLFLQIVAFPSGTSSGSNWTWQHQLTAPLDTLMNVRTQAQETRNNFESVIALERTPYVLTYSGQDAPLSWHLTKAQQESIRASWRNLRNDDVVQQIKTALACPEQPTSAHN